MSVIGVCILVSDTVIASGNEANTVKGTLRFEKTVS